MIATQNHPGLSVGYNPILSRMVTFAGRDIIEDMKPRTIKGLINNSLYAVDNYIHIDRDLYSKGRKDILGSALNIPVHFHHVRNNRKRCKNHIMKGYKSMYTHIEIFHIKDSLADHLLHDLIRERMKNKMPDLCVSIEENDNTLTCLALWK